MGFAVQVRKYAVIIPGSRASMRVACGLTLFASAVSAPAQQPPGPNTVNPTIAEIVSQLPKGPALTIINEKCSACHSTATVFGQRRKSDDWAATVQLMVDRGADLSPDEAGRVVDYLSSNLSEK